MPFIASLDPKKLLSGREKKKRDFIDLDMKKKQDFDGLYRLGREKKTGF